ncbi:hypothetical protein [Kitasatospora sp. NPDC057541]|uniref:hypothetical protein n=1 Tax=unclassified Kitasatospora TaxID=2633591 RepID=UPI0036C8440E
MPSDVPRSPGRVPIAVYIASPGGDPGGVLETHCRQYAETREWVVAVVFTDSGPLPALEERAGWRAVQNALETGAARGVVMWTRSMVVDSAEAWERLAVLLGELGWFLAAGAIDTPGQPLYGRGGEQAPGGGPVAFRAAAGGLSDPELLGGARSP